MSALNPVLENDAGVKVVEVDGDPITITRGFTITKLSGSITVDDGSPSLLTTPVAVDTPVKLFGRGRVQIAAT